MTINEMLVVIIISTIVLGMAFSVLRIVQKHMWSIESHISSNMTLLRLEQSLWIDFNRYTSANYNIKTSQLNFESELDTVSYNFSKQYIVKTKDTFKLSTIKMHTFFNGKPIINGEIDAIKLEFGRLNAKKVLFVYKRKDANQFMN